MWDFYNPYNNTLIRRVYINGFYYDYETDCPTITKSKEN